MVESQQDNLVAVRRHVKRRRAEHYALVLAAIGVGSTVARDGKLATVWVAEADAERAQAELAAYDSENPERPPAKKRASSPLPPFDVPLIYWAVLLFFFAAARRDAFSFDWVGEGAVQAGLMREGEWWRAVTALCLHVDVAHLLGNLVFGTIFLVLLAQVTGAGLAALAMVAAGAFGNVVNALIQSPAHASIGASTGVFAALGVLVAVQQVWRPDRKPFSLRTWAPLAGGATLLLFLGFSGQKTDILAHVLGFGAGLAAGWLLTRRDRDWAADRGLQWKCAGAAAAIIAAAWAAAAVA